jgi:arginine:ornithine antiporter/lysine permease
MVGAGIFALPSALGRATGGLGALIAWGIAGTGMLMLAFVFQTLSRRRPDLDAGIYAYARAGFGNYLGFASALGYWTGCCLAVVACLVLIKSTLGQFFPVFGDGTTPFAILVASLLLWGVHFLILRGVRQAAALNTIATAAKIVPLGVFIVVAIAAFQADIFAVNFWGGESHELPSVASQVRNTMLVTVFVFVGIEGASVYSRYARKRSDVGLATVMGFLGVLALLVLVTLLSYAILPRPELAALRDPSLAGVMRAIVGPWGVVFVSIGLIVAVLGNFLAWSLLAAEVLHSAAGNDTMPAALARENANQAPAAALWLTSGVVQVFLIVSWFAEHAFTLALKMTGAVMLIPYLLVAAYGLKLASRGETYSGEPRARARDLVRSAIATVYAVGMIYAGGAKYLLLSALIFAPGTLLFVRTRRERKERVFGGAERLILAAIVLAAVVAIYGLATGSLSV